ncbi:MAG: aminotransferase class I/II-fold pyridoxal phosphate-dependent enzyme [Parvicellaceae bacterium]
MKLTDWVFQVKNNMGMAQNFLSHPSCLAIVYPLGKAAGLSGAFVVGSKLLKDYLINFSRPFIFSTGPSKLLIHALHKQLKALTEKRYLKFKKVESLFYKFY